MEEVNLHERAEAMREIKQAIKDTMLVLRNASYKLELYDRNTDMGEPHVAARIEWAAPGHFRMTAL